jgi:type VI secretion system protein ImpA
MFEARASTLASSQLSVVLFDKLARSAPLLCALPHTSPVKRVIAYAQRRMMGAAMNNKADAAFESAFARFDVVGILADVSSTQPCGVNLDDEGDVPFMTFLANAEGILPTSYFAFDRSSVDMSALIQSASSFLAQSRDMRLLVMLAKLSILNRDLERCAYHLVALARLCDEKWSSLHPQAIDGDHSYRISILQSLDDPPTMTLPLQHAPLMRHERLGPISYRAHLLSSGKAAPRHIQSEDGDQKEESYPDLAALDRALGEINLGELIRARDSLLAINCALGILRAASVAKVGHSNAVRFDNLDSLSRDMAHWLDGYILNRDPTRAALSASSFDDSALIISTPATPDQNQADASMLTPVASLEDCAAALTALDRYFCRREPSNPALLLLRQAYQLLGKSYLDALRVIAPNLTDQARIALGRIDGFALQLERLSDFADIETFDSASADKYDVTNRTDAVALIGMIIAYHARAEPSSVVPLLLERARKMCGQDFITILKELLPIDTM